LNIRIGPSSSKDEIGKARKQIIMMYHPDKWQTDKEKATFFTQKVNVAWRYYLRSNRCETLEKNYFDGNDGEYGTLSKANVF
jgi:curved DNA-binding protein CbpA